MKKIIVKFLKTVSPYQAGEVAGFDADIAQKLIAEKKAIEHKDSKKADAPKGDPKGSSAGTGGQGGTPPVDGGAPDGTDPPAGD